MFKKWKKKYLRFSTLMSSKVIDITFFAIVVIRDILLTLGIPLTNMLAILLISIRSINMYRIWDNSYIRRKLPEQQQFHLHCGIEKIRIFFYKMSFSLNLIQFCLFELLMIVTINCYIEENCETIPTEIHVTKGKLCI